MSNPVRSSVPPRPEGKAQAASGRIGVGSVVCGLLLTLGHLVTGYLALLAYLAEPAGPWDSESVSHSNFASGFALAFSAVTALLTWAFVKAGWLRGWWYVIPVALAVTALLRLTLLTPEL